MNARPSSRSSAAAPPGSPPAAEPGSASPWWPSSQLCTAAAPGSRTTRAAAPRSGSSCRATPARRSGPARGRPGWLAPMSLVRRDADDAALPRREAEALLGDVERAVAPDRHSGREHQARDDRLGRMARAHAHDRAGARSWAAWRRAHLERVHLAAAERETEHLLEARPPHLEVVARGQLPDVLVRGRAVIGAEETEIGDVPDAVTGDGRGHDRER